MTIKEIAFVAYPVTDVPRARAFYETVLGLKPASVFEKDGTAFIEYWIGQNNEHCIVLGAGAPMFQPGKTGATAALEVENFEAAEQRINERQVKIVMPRYDTPVCSMMMIEDPDGNQIMIHRRKQA